MKLWRCGGESAGATGGGCPRGPFPPQSPETKWGQRGLSSEPDGLKEAWDLGEEGGVTKRAGPQTRLNP